MSSTSGITYNLPFCQRDQREQTDFSIGSRVALIALGIICLVTSILIFSQVVSTTGTSDCWILFAAGVSLISAGTFLKEVKIEDKRDTPLRAVLANDLDKLRKWGIESPEWVNATDLEGRTPLHRAIELGRAEAAKVLIEELDADVNAMDYKKKTPLQYGVSHNQLEIVKALVTNPNVDGNASRDIYGRTPLHLAAGLLICPEILEELKKLNLNVEARDAKKRTPLHQAALNGRLRATEIFVNDLKAEVNATDCENRTPLHLVAIGQKNFCLAMVSYFSETFLFLLKQGADLYHKDVHGKTPFDYAKGLNSDSEVQEAIAKAKKHQSN